MLLEKTMFVLRSMSFLVPSNVLTIGIYLNVHSELLTSMVVYRQETNYNEGNLQK